MAYTITLTDGTVLTTVANNTVDTTTSLALIGRNVSGYGGYIAENFVHMLEHFADSSPPGAPLIGQLFYNKSSNALQMWTGSAWADLGLNAEGVIDSTDVTIQNHSLILTNSAAPANRRNWRVRVSNASPYIGMLVFEALNDNGTVRNTVMALDGVNDLIIGQNGRILATGTLNLYVSPTGSDSNSGLSSGSPFLTIQKAVNTLYTNYDLGGFAAIINLAAGTHTSGASMVGQPFGAAPADGAPVNIVGAGSGSTTVSVTAGNCFMASNGVGISVSGLKMIATGSIGNLTGIALSATLASTLNLGSDIVFGACSLAMYASTAADIGINHAYTIAGGAATHMQATSAGTITSGGQTVTITGTPAFSSAFAEADTLGAIDVPNMVYSGSATGVRYSVTTNAILSSGGGGANYFPGNSPGVSSLGGLYI